MRTIFTIILIAVLLAGGIYLAKHTDNFTNFDKIFDKIYEQVDKNMPPIEDIIPSGQVQFNKNLI